MVEQYDIVIIGGGPAGLSAGIYASRALRKSLLIEMGFTGGQIVDAEFVENYPGFPDGISGLGLTGLMHRQAEKFGLNTLMAEVTGIELNGESRIVKTSSGDFASKAVIIASGSERDKLGALGEAEFSGRGVSYCATCDGAFFRDQVVAVVGGGDAAITEALHLTSFAQQVIIIHRRQALRATPLLGRRAAADPKLAFRWNSVVEQIEGGDVVKSLRLRNVKTDDVSTLDVSGVFIAIGFKPNTAYLKGMLPLDTDGYIITNEKMETDVPGIYAVGDIRAGSIRQVVSATGDGATAAVYAEEYIIEHERF